MEEEQDDMEIIVNRVEMGYMPDAVNLAVFQHNNEEDPILVQLKLRKSRCLRSSAMWTKCYSRGKN